METKANIQTDSMVDNKELRQKYIDRVEILDKLKKKLFLIPQLEMVTLKQISDFYEVPLKTVETCFRDNKDEIMVDGVAIVKAGDISEKFNSLPSNESNFVRVRGGILMTVSENIQIMIPNVGSRMFPKRAVLRFGMLLRDSAVAQEVRTQLLNVFEHTETENPQALTAEIDNEQELLMEVARTFSSGDMMKFAEATMKLNAYKDRHIKAVEEKNAELTEQNETLTKDNDILSGNILEWSNRASANKVVRLMAAELKWEFATAWSEIYNELLYKHNINLKARKTRDGRSSFPMLAFLHDDEWEILYTTIAAMLQARYVNPSKIFEKAKLTIE